MKKVLFLIALALITACDTSKLSETSPKQFIGQWELKGRSLYDGIKIEIKEGENETFKGQLIELNENKYVQMFSTIGDTWVSSIKRKSNFAFELREKRIASPLFSSYGLGTSDKYTVEFVTKNKIRIGEKGSTVFYKRVQK